MSETAKALNIETVVNINREEDDDGNSKFIAGMPHFFSTPPEGFVKYLLDIQQPIPKVNLSRNGSNSNCNMHISDLQSHNGHAPSFTDEIELMGYIDRVLEHIAKACESLDISMTQIKKELMKTMVASLSTWENVKKNGNK